MTKSISTLCLTVGLRAANQPPCRPILILMRRRCNRRDVLRVPNSCDRNHGTTNTCPGYVRFGSRQMTPAFAFVQPAASRRGPASPRCPTACRRPHRDVRPAASPAGARPRRPRERGRGRFQSFHRVPISRPASGDSLHVLLRSTSRPPLRPTAALGADGLPHLLGHVLVEQKLTPPEPPAEASRMNPRTSSGCRVADEALLVEAADGEDELNGDIPSVA